MANPIRPPGRVAVIAEVPRPSHSSQTRLRVTPVVIEELEPAPLAPRAELHLIAGWIDHALAPQVDPARALGELNDSTDDATREQSAMVSPEVSDPKPVDPDSGKHNTRRSSGARREASERVTLRRGSEEITGWTLNVSRGGVRVIVEDPLVLDDELDVQVGDIDDAIVHPGRVVWIKEQADGQIIGVQFTDVEGAVAPSQPPPPVEID